MLKIHEKIRELRIEHGMTQADLAKELGIVPQTLSFYENGREPNLEIIKSISELFKVSVDYLIGNSNIKNPLEIKAIDISKDKYFPYEALEPYKWVIKSIEMNLCELMPNLYGKGDLNVLLQFDNVLKELLKANKSGSGIKEIFNLFEVIEFKNPLTQRCLSSMYDVILLMDQEPKNHYDTNYDLPEEYLRLKDLFEEYDKQAEWFNDTKIKEEGE